VPIGAHVVANPLGEFLNARIGERPGGLGEVGHLVEKLLLLFEDGARICAGDGPGRSFGHGGHLRFFFRLEFGLSQ
jgi:hypothetical protein